MKKIFLTTLLLGLALYAKSDLFESMPNISERTQPKDSNEILSFYNSIKDVKHSVVNISTTKNIRGSKDMEDLMSNPFFRQFFGNNMPRNRKKRKTSTLGSGVIVTNDGYILTNNHVIANSDEILVTINGSKEEHKAKLIGTDPKTDIAIIKIKGTNFKAAKFANSSDLKEGDIVFALGNPFGIGSSVTQGIISALNKNRVGINQYENFIQTDAAINQGNSGGALVDSRGALIGINSAILSRSGGSNGIGFAIPSNMVKNIARRLIEFGKIDRGYLGVSISDLTKSLKSLYKNSNGAIIVDIVKGDAASLAGLKRGDLIVTINDEQIKSANDLKNTIASFAPNQEIEIKYEREKKEYEVKLTLGDQSSAGENKSKFIKGLTLENLDNNLRQKFSIISNIKGVFVSKVKLNSDAQKYGFIAGDIIIQVENVEINRIKDLDIISKRLSNRAKRVYINRNGYIVIIVIDN